MTCADAGSSDVTYTPVTGRVLNAYARGLRRSVRSLSRSAARALADKHEAERAAAHQQKTTTGKEAMPNNQDWYCPECCANFSGPGTCPADDITLVQGDPDVSR